jgi:hypothetical protein
VCQSALGSPFGVATRVLFVSNHLIMARENVCVGRPLPWLLRVVLTVLLSRCTGQAMGSANKMAGLTSFEHDHGADTVPSLSGISSNESLGTRRGRGQAGGQGGGDTRRREQAMAFLDEEHTIALATRRLASIAPSVAAALVSRNSKELTSALSAANLSPELLAEIETNLTSAIEAANLSPELLADIKTNLAAHTTDATESTRQSQVTGQGGQGKAVSRSVSHSMANSVEGLTFTGYDCGNYPQAKPKCESDAFLCHDTMPLGEPHHIESGTNITHSLPNLTYNSPPSH